MEQLSLIEPRKPGQPTVSGEQSLKPVSEIFQPQYEYHNGLLDQGNSIAWVKSLDEASIDLVFGVPAYNLKKTDWDTPGGVSTFGLTRTLPAKLESSLPGIGQIERKLGEV